MRLDGRSITGRRQDARRSPSHFARVLSSATRITPVPLRSLLPDFACGLRTATLTTAAPLRSPAPRFAWILRSATLTAPALLRSGGALVSLRASRLGPAASVIEGLAALMYSTA